MADSTATTVRIAQVSAPGTTAEPELAKAQYVALSNLMPTMYVVVIVSSWTLAASHWRIVPLWLAFACPMALSSVCAIRTVTWWKRRHAHDMSGAAAARALVTTRWAAFALALCFTVWAISLFQYGDAYTRSHSVLFLTTAIMGCIACLTAIRSVALMLAAFLVVGLGIMGWMNDVATLRFMVLGSALTIGAILISVYIQSNNFRRMVRAQTEADTLIREQHRLLRIIDDMPNAVMIGDPATHCITYFNDATAQLLQRLGNCAPATPDDLVGMPIDFLLGGDRDPAGNRISLQPEDLPRSAYVRLGTEILSVHIGAVESTDQSYLGPMLTWSVVTQEVSSEKRILQLAHYDTLTGLANRALFRKQLETAVTRADGACALMLVDLDGFKLINDSRGHLIGDAMLRMVANRLREACGYPGITIGRLGGDEFAVLIERPQEDQSPAMATMLIDVLTEPYPMGVDMKLQVGASVGIALSPRDATDAETLLSRADIALYAAKAAGKGTFMMFDSQMESRIHERVNLETMLREALDTGTGLTVFYQQIVDARTQALSAREALARWEVPGRGWIPPSEFIPVAEDCGLIEKLGRFVLHRACMDAQQWPADVRVAVNVSAGQLGKDSFVGILEEALRDSGLSPQRLEIEVTESALISDADACVAELHQARAMGVRVALDDFGTGFSSLAHLRAFPFDTIKVDGSFVRDVATRQDCAAVVKVIADLGKRLGVTTVAEGVETAEQFEKVVAEGCSEIQGYLFGKPVPNGSFSPAAEAQDQPVLKSGAAPA